VVVAHNHSKSLRKRRDLAATAGLEVLAQHLPVGPEAPQAALGVGQHRHPTPRVEGAVGEAVGRDGRWAQVVGDLEAAVEHHRFTGLHRQHPAGAGGEPANAGQRHEVVSPPHPGVGGHPQVAPTQQQGPHRLRRRLGLQDPATPAVQVAAAVRDAQANPQPVGPEGHIFAGVLGAQHRHDRPVEPGQRHPALAAEGDPLAVG
jgi:hypothetical protein